MPTHDLWEVGREVAFIVKTIVHHEFSKDIGQLVDESLTSHCQNTGIVLKLENLDLIQA